VTILRMTPDGSFADIREEVRRRVDGGERIALLLLDALGLRFPRRPSPHAPAREVWLRSAALGEVWF
jgi:hypothetical protein